MQEKGVYSQELYSQEATTLPQSVGVFGNFYPIFQANSPLIRPDGSKKKIDPFYQYFELNAASPENHISFNTFLRGREILNGDDRSFDVYNAFLEFNNTNRTYDVRIGRQIITEGTNFVLLDGGLVRVRPIDGLQVVAYGGYQDRDAQPNPEEPQKSFSAFGIKLLSDKLLESIISVGYERFDPNGFSPRHFLNVNFNRAVPFTNSADVYSRAEIDLGEKNLALFTGGVGITPFSSLHLNLEYDTYKPDKNRDAFLQDRIFDLFSLSRLHEARVGATLIPATFLQISASYSFARYDVLNGTSTNGNIVKVGLSWDFWRQIGFKTFQGFYLIDGRQNDRAVGLNFGVSEEVLRGLDLQFSFAYAHFDSITNKSGNGFSYIMGTQYLVIRNLLLKAELEINSNPDFKRDVRPNLAVSYYF